MHIERLHIQHLRCIEDTETTLRPGLSVFIGANGAGKTSILEAIFMLSRGRSFRAGSRDVVIQRGAKRFSVFAEVLRRDGTRRQLGLGKEGGRWQARVDGDAALLSDLVHDCPVVCFDPGSHALISGPAEERRRFLDWGVFHVEPNFLSPWRRYQRALKQRNVLLRQARLIDSGLLLPWEEEMDAAAGAIDELRQLYVQQLQPALARYASLLLPELGSTSFDYRRGWSAERCLAEALARHRERDALRGYTSDGPHRADWALSFEHAPSREQLSRGQEKLTALVCLLAQAERYGSVFDEWPVFILDDLASELDQAHQAALIGVLEESGSQVLVTGTSIPDSLQRAALGVFHVEQGRLTRLLQ